MASTQVVAIPFGDPGWTPLIGDWDGSGPDQISAYDPSTATFCLGDNGGAAKTVTTFGDPNWVPLVGDWSGAASRSGPRCASATAACRVRAL